MRDPAGPFITYYDTTSGERTELSTTSLRNWQSKTANLLIDSYGLGAGDRVSLALPPHWLTPVVIGAIAWVGAELVTDGGPAELAIIGPELLDDPPSANDLLACSMHPFGMGFTTPLPPGVDDFFNEVRAHGDYYPGSNTSPIPPALLPLAEQLVGSLSLANGDRYLLQNQPGADTTALISAVPELIGGSVVLIAGDAYPEQIERIAIQEKATPLTR